MNRKFLVWPGKPLKRIFKDSEPDNLLINKSLELSGVRNEYEGCMFGIRALVDVHELKLHATDLISEGSRISRSNISLNFVGSIPLSRNTPNTPQEELERLAPFYAPDPILDVESVDVKAGETQPCYFLIYIPKDAEPGEYKGEIMVSSREDKATLKVNLKVFPVKLPDKRNLFITNWFSLENIAKAYNVSLWSEDFWKIFEKWIKFMAEHRQNVFWVPLETISVSFEEGNYSFNFSIFDRYVEILIKYGADRIEITHVASFKQWGGKEISLRNFKVRYDGEEKEEEGSKVIPLLLPVLEKHLEEKGWIDKTVIHIADEPTEDGLESWIEISKLVHNYAPRLKRIDAIETTGFNDNLEIWVPTLHHFNDWIEEYEEAMKEGKEVWFYTCLNPKNRYPNRLLDYPLIKTRILHWINYAYSLKGFLHWGFNFWSEDPFGEPSKNLPPGDTHIAYPGKEGPISSLRLEAMRDGIEDYELLKLFEEKIRRIKEELGFGSSKLQFERRPLEICKKAVPSITEYVRDPDVFIEIRNELIKEIVEVENRPLVLVLTEPPEWRKIFKDATTIIVRGICESNSEVEVNNKKIELMNNYFSTYTYPMQDGTVTIKVKKEGLEKVIVRKFNVV